MPCEHLYCWRSSESQGHAKPFLWQQGGTEPRSWAHSSSCARARLDLCELCNFCATSASGDSPITERAIGHRSTTRPASRSVLSSPVQLGHGRSAQLHQHTPALTGWTLRFCVEGHAPARASHELKKRTLQSHDPNRRSCDCHMRRWLALRGQRASCPSIRPRGCPRKTKRFVTLSFSTPVVELPTYSHNMLTLQITHLIKCQSLN